MSEKLTEQKILDLLQANEAHIKAFGVRSLGLLGSFVHGDNSEGKLSETS